MYKTAVVSCLVGREKLTRCPRMKGGASLLLSLIIAACCSGVASQVTGEYPLNSVIWIEAVKMKWNQARSEGQVLTRRQPVKIKTEI